MMKMVSFLSDNFMKLNSHFLELFFSVPWKLPCRTHSKSTTIAIPQLPLGFHLSTHFFGTQVGLTEVA